MIQQSEFRNILQAVGTLQTQYSSLDTEAMKGRGLYIRYDGAATLTQWLGDFEFQPHPKLGPYGVRGNDGIGRKSRIPWIRAYFSNHSPKTTAGWYVVYLFEANGNHVYLSINQGTTDLVNGSFVNKNPAELKNRVISARKLLGGFASSHDRFTTEIALNSQASGLGSGYERGHVLGVKYDVSDLPSETTLFSDFIDAWEGLKTIHLRELDYGDASTLSHSEVTEAEEAVRSAAGKSGGAGQGFGLSKPEKDAVEQRAMDKVIEYYIAGGWSVDDVHANHSFDIQCSKAGEVIDVEIKGTTSKGASVVLTFNEVEHMRDAYPNTTLAVVSSIVLKKSDEQIIASGGDLRLIHPWEINDGDLRPIGYKYSVPVDQQVKG